MLGTKGQLSSALGIPAFRCVLRDSNVIRGLNAFMGASANLAKEKALLGALNEALQSRLTLITGSRDDIFPDEYQRQKAAFASVKEKTIGNYSYQASPNFAVKQSEQLTVLQQQLLKHPYQHIFVVSHTKMELNIPVVHVFIPGMLFDEPRLSAGGRSMGRKIPEAEVRTASESPAYQPLRHVRFRRLRD